jgi:hypothetical protein
MTMFQRLSIERQGPFTFVRTVSTVIRRGVMNDFLFRTSSGILLLFVMILMLASCAFGPGIAGKWRQVGREATLEFSGDGSFRAVDNEGMAVSGTYRLSGDSSLRFAIHHAGAPEEIVDLQVSLHGDVLTLKTPDLRETEQYRREE